MNQTTLSRGGDSGGPHRRRHPPPWRHLLGRSRRPQLAAASAAQATGSRRLLPFLLPSTAPPTLPSPAALRRVNRPAGWIRPPVGGSRFPFLGSSVSRGRRQPLHPCHCRASSRDRSFDPRLWWPDLAASVVSWSVPTRTWVSGPVHALDGGWHAPNGWTRWRPCFAAVGGPDGGGRVGRAAPACPAWWCPSTRPSGPLHCRAGVGGGLLRLAPTRLGAAMSAPWLPGRVGDGFGAG